MGRHAGAGLAAALTARLAVVRPTPTFQPRSAWPWAWCGLAAGVLCAVLAFAPARWLAAAVARATDGRLLLREPRGTVWNGSAEIALTGGPGSADAIALPDRADWRLRPRWDGVRAEFTVACCTAQPIALRAHIAPGGVLIQVADGQSQWPASLLAGLGTPWNTLQFDGELALSTQSLSVEWVQGRLAIAGRAELRAQRMSSRLSTLRPMGSYRITVLGGATPSLQLETLEGALQLAGRGQWVGSRLRFTGTASAAPDSESALSNLLNIIGRRSGPRSIISIG
jgi:general secretion pathway protein N